MYMNVKVESARFVISTCADGLEPLGGGQGGKGEVG